jgi:hypothetical protein
MHGVAPQCTVKGSRPSLGGEAEGRSLGFILVTYGAEFAGSDKSSPTSLWAPHRSTRAFLAFMWGCRTPHSGFAA